MFRSLAIAAALALSACASTPTYTPARTDGGAGYSETQIEANRYFVTYRAPGAANESLVHDYALLRAADITLERGKDWFWVDRRSFDGQSRGGRSGPSIGVGVGGGRWSGGGGTFGSVGINVPFGGGGGATVRSATLEIRLGAGPKPDDANAYDARAIATNLRARQTY
jgi:hypothetical protein